VENPRVRILAKLEGCNPGGSVKDRPALYMIQKAEESGELKPGKVILEPTSGNTGIALAMIGVAKGYEVKLCLPGCVSTERQYILQGFGAEVLITPDEEGTDGAIRTARRILEEDPDRHFMPDQFSNTNNVLSHYETTGPEIWKQTDGTIDVFVAGMGTTGTLMGTGRFLKEKKQGVRIVGVEPVKGHSIQGLKNMKEAIVPSIYNRDKMDEKIVIDDEEAFEMTKVLALRHGLFLGMSSGAAVAGAVQVAGDMQDGTMVVILPDRGERYLSTNLFRSFCAKCPP